jgi:hypothetical protein
VEYRGTTLAADETAVLFPDGWVAVVRMNPYRVDWRSPDGRWVHGKPLPYERIPIDGAEKEAWRERYEQSFHMKAPPVQSIPFWADEFPPFESEQSLFALLPAPNGHLFVRKPQTKRSTLTEYDIVDRTGALAGRLTMELRQSIVAFGAASIYVTTYDEDNMQTVSRHPWSWR